MVRKKATRYVLTCGTTAVLVFMAAVRVLSIACIVRWIDDYRITITCGLHCGFTSAQYCDIHGVHSQHSRCLQPFKKQDRLSHTDCTEKKQHSPSTTLHDKGEQNTEQVVGYTATAWLCMYAYKTAAGWSAIRRGRRDAVLCEDLHVPNHGHAPAGCIIVCACVIVMRGCRRTIVCA